MLYFDTCIISGFVRNDIPEEELRCLILILKEFEQGKINIVTSEVARTELSKIPDQYRGPHMELYNLLTKLPFAKTYEHTSRITLLGVGGTRIDPLYLTLRKILPDENDILHLFQACKNGAHYFVTVDTRTILKYSSDIQMTCGIIAVNPSTFHSILMTEERP